MENKPKLLDQVRENLRLRGRSLSTEKAYVYWIKRYIHYHGLKHPKEMGKDEIEKFLTSLVITSNVASSTQNQAFNAIIYLYSNVLNIKLDEGIDAMRSKKPQRLPVVLTKEEVMEVISLLKGVFQLMGMLLYGSGLRSKLHFYPTMLSML